jgi:crotonobetainyl-CoA:carnitine CoA-transferase CaiB-like acyl-CoA transferase
MAGKPLSGVRVVEAAQFTFVPGAGAVLADWGADVIKIEHPVAGDAQRGFAMNGTRATGTAFAPIMEHANRGKRSIGLALDTAAGREVLDEIVRRSDVFTTNYLPGARARLRLDVADIHDVNRDIIYVRGTAVGARGPEAAKGGYDQGAFWCRGGGSAGVTPAELPGMLGQPGPAFGDSIGALAIAAGICAALVGRAAGNGGEVVDVSLLGLAAWANGLSVDTALLTGQPWSAPPLGSGFVPSNPMATMYRTADGRWIQLSMLQPGRYWSDFCVRIDRPELSDDARFATAEALLANAGAARDCITASIEQHTLAEWRLRLETFEGQWEVVQNSLEVGNDPQLIANGYIAEVEDSEGATQRLVTAPVQFDEMPAQLRRSPSFAEHSHEIMVELGFDEDEIVQLQIDGVVA